MAVSSWNDNGQKQFVHDPSLYYDTLTFKFLSLFRGNTIHFAMLAFCRSSLPLGFLSWAWMDVNKIHLD